MIRPIGLVSLVAVLLSSCAAVPHDPPQVAQVQPTTFGLSNASTSIAADWWTAFKDPQLDTLVTMGLAANPSLDRALARVRMAQATLGVRRGDQLPQVTLDGQSTYQRFPDRSLYPPPFAGNAYPTTSVQANLNWNLDLFGRQRALVAGARADVAAAALDAAAARLMVSTSIAQAYVGLARADQLIRVADSFVATRRQALGFVNSRIRNKLASQFELRQAETLLAEADQARTRAVAQRELLVHAIAALVGRGADFYPQIASPKLAFDAPPMVPAMLPADLLGRRPDLLAGQARIDSAAAGRKVARADFLPNVSIQALAGFAALGLGSFFDLGARTYGAGPAIHVPIFEGGKLKAQYRGATAALDEAVAAYDDAVLGAVRDSADALTQVRATDQDTLAQRRVVAGLRETVRLDQVRVSTGLGSQLDSIDAGFRLLEAEQALVGLQSDALTRRIQLIAALGGGFDSSSPPPAAALADSAS
ncbi:efflux transporter outer membrane subunit [Sphingomonas sp. PAMC 26621]|uniref:efflux transporter outer membrane subunit n=1 Tax=Sphingomonas sp. PAMC 26621 TaxID=1112213 RepID=UPI0002897B95|nr:efflux transporter outer membrane subunit [Sphingomonas sp. PAMC 26621]